MKIYSDNELQHELINTLDLGIVDAGEEKEFTFYLLNDTPARLERLEFTIEHNEVETIKAPETLSANERGILVVKWSPSVTLKEGLQAKLHIEGKSLWG